MCRRLKADVKADVMGMGTACRIREMRQPQAGCNAPSAIITAAAQFIDIADVTPQACSTKPIDYSYSLGYHVSPSCLFRLRLIQAP